MKLRLLRQEESDNGKATIGSLFVNGMWECFTLEDKIRDVKIYGETCIPEGTYQVVVDMSARFRRLMPHILNVPHFDGIRIHSGNTDADTAGCILLGRIHRKGEDLIGESRLAYDAFFKKLQDALAVGESCEITIESGIGTKSVEGVDV